MSWACRKPLSHATKGSLRNHDGYGDENVTSKYQFELLFNMSEVSYNWIGTEGFEVKSETERYAVVCPRWSFHVVVLTSTAGNCSKMRAARAARSFWFF